MNELAILDPLLLENVKLPMPATHTYPTDGRKYVDILFSRGCMKRCEFCVAGSKNYLYDKLDLEIAERQLRVFKDAEYKELILQDNDLLRDKEHFFNVLKLIKKYSFKWQDNGGIAIEDLDEEVANAIIKYDNCTALYIPFNPRYYLVKQAAKRATEKYSGNVRQLKRLREAGIYVYTSGIYGTHFQTKSDIDQEIEIYKSLITEGYVDHALVFALSHLPATRSHELFSHDIINPHDWVGYSILTPHAKTKHMGIRDVEVAIIKAYHEFNSVQSSVSEWRSAFPQ